MVRRSSVATVFVGVLGHSVLAAVSALLVAALAGPSVKGILASLVAVSTITSTVFMFGMNGAAAYFVGRGDWRYSDSVSVAVATTLWTTGLAALAWWALMSSPWGSQGVAANISVVAVAAATGAQTLNAVVGAVLIGAQRFKAFSVQQILTPLLTIAAFLTLRFLKMDLTGAALASWVTGIVAPRLYLIGSLTVESQFRLTWPARFRNALSYGARSAAAAAMNVATLRLDVVLIGALAGAQVVGQYSLGVQFSELLWMIPTAIGYVVLPSVAASRGDDGSSTASACRKALLLGLVLSVLVVMVAIGYVTVVPAFRPSIIALLILLPGTVLFTVAKVVGNDLQGRGLPEAHIWAAGASALLTIGGGIALIPAFGLVGAAVVSSISYVLYAAIILRWFSAATHNKPWTVVVPTWADVLELREILSLRTMRTALERYRRPSGGGGAA